MPPRRKAIARKKATKKAPAKSKPKPKAKPSRATKARTKPAGPRQTTKGRTKPKRDPGSLTKPCAKPQSLIGPIELDILENPMTKQRIVLLGDIHVNEVKCKRAQKCGVTILQYLEDLFRNYRGAEPIDFFLEMPYTETQEREHMKALEDPKEFAILKELFKQNAYRPMQGSFLNALRNFYFDCLQRLKTTCRFYGKPIRFHYSDVRRGVLHSGTSGEAKEDFKELNELFKPKILADVRPKHIKFLQKYVAKMEAKDVDYFLHLTKIDKQLRKIQEKNPGAARALREFVLDRLSSAKGLNVDDIILKKMAENLRKGKLAKVDWMEGEVDYFRARSIIIGVRLNNLFDVYTMARIARHNMRQVIVYAGKAHTIEIRSFLQEKLGFVPLIPTQKSEGSDSFQCIDLKDVPRPWF